MKFTRTALLSSLVLPLLGCPDDDPPPSSDESTGSSTSTTGATTVVMTTVEPPSDSSSSSTAMADESTSTGSEEGLPDIDMSVVGEDTLASIYTQTLSFSEQACTFVDGCLGGTGSRRLLRFDTITPNLGTADFHVGNPTANPELFEQSACSGSWLFANYASYRLLDAKGAEVGTGHKSAFALIDLAPFTQDAGPPQYGFGEDMGISVGWADIYGAGLDCQWVDITDLPAGEYTLELSINPEQVVLESSFDNNILQLPITLTDDSDVPSPPPEWVCPAGYYGFMDGCDCGCGALDPDCVDMTVDSCDYCMEPGCASSCADIDPENNATCL